MELDQRQKLWLEHIKTWQNSGMTQDAYCKTNSLHPKTFSNWKRMLREHLPGLQMMTNSKIASSTPVTPLVAVKLTDDPVEIEITTSPKKQSKSVPSIETSTKKSSCIDLSVGGKYRVSVEPDFDAETLRRLLTTLAEI